MATRRVTWTPPPGDTLEVSLGGGDGSGDDSDDGDGKIASGRFDGVGPLEGARETNDDVSGCKFYHRDFEDAVTGSVADSSTAEETEQNVACCTEIEDEVMNRNLGAEKSSNDGDETVINQL